MTVLKTTPLSLKIAIVVSLLFGLLTVFSGAMALSGNKEVGNAVPFVLWFNFLAGFAYVAASFGLAQKHSWACKLSIAIAVATALVFAAFGLHVMQGGAYEMRTVAAMVVRTGVWVVVSAIAIRAFRLSA